MLTVEKLVGYLKDGSTQISVKLEYSQDGRDTNTNERTHEYGVVLSTREVGNGFEYTSLHFHYPYKQSAVTSTPQISAHFKAGRGKTAQQGHELKVWDAYALYLLLCMIQPNDTSWKPFKIHVTEQKIADLIQSKNLRALDSIFLSKVFDLAFWDPEAWARFMWWQIAR